MKKKIDPVLIYLLIACAVLFFIGEITASGILLILVIGYFATKSVKK